MSEFESFSVETSCLSIEVAGSGPVGGEVVILLHGWPDSARTWLDIVPRLAGAGYRVLMPSLRGFGGTRFLSSEARRSGQLSALGKDVIELADALGIDRFYVVGHDWGARAAYIVTCLWPDRAKACVALSVGWGTNSPDQSISLRQAQNYWYHWYMATAHGEKLVRDRRQEFTEYIWNAWCPFWSISPDEFARTSQAFANPDWAAVVLHSYRHRWGWAEADPAYADLESELRNPPPISRPTLVLHGAQDPCNAPTTSEAKDHLFLGPYRRELIERCGHFPQREHPELVANHLLSWLVDR